MPRGRRPWTWVLLALALYVAVLLGTPFLHHDFACHQRLPGHCPACLANPPAPRTAESPSLAAHRLADAGSIEGQLQRSAARHVASPSPGRSPPA